MEEAMEIHHDGQVHLTGTVPTLDWIDQSTPSLYGVRRSWRIESIWLPAIQCVCVCVSYLLSLLLRTQRGSFVCFQMTTTLTADCVLSERNGVCHLPIRCRWRRPLSTRDVLWLGRCSGIVCAWPALVGDWWRCVLGVARRQRPTPEVDRWVSNEVASHGRTDPVDSERRRRRRHPLGVDVAAACETPRRNGVSGGDSAVALAPTLSWAPPLRSQPDVSPNQLDTKEKNEKIKR